MTAAAAAYYHVFSSAIPANLLISSLLPLLRYISLDSEMKIMDSFVGNSVAVFPPA